MSFKGLFCCYFHNKQGNILEYSYSLLEPSSSYSSCSSSCSCCFKNIEMLLIGNNYQKTTWNINIFQINQKNSSRNYPEISSSKNKENNKMKNENKENEKESDDERINNNNYNYNNNNNNQENCKRNNTPNSLSSHSPIILNDQTHNNNNINNNNNNNNMNGNIDDNELPLWCLSVFHCYKTTNSEERFSRMRSIGIISNSLSDCYQMISLLKYLTYQINDLNGNTQSLNIIATMLFELNLSPSEVFNNFFTQNSTFLDEFNRIIPISQQTSLPLYHYYITDPTPSHLMLLSHYLLFPSRILLYTTYQTHFLCEFALQLLHSVDYFSSIKNFRSDFYPLLYRTSGYLVNSSELDIIYSTDLNSPTSWLICTTDFSLLEYDVRSIQQGGKGGVPWDILITITFPDDPLDSSQQLLSLKSTTTVSQTFRSTLNNYIDKISQNVLFSIEYSQNFINSSTSSPNSVVPTTLPATPKTLRNSSFLSSIWPYLHNSQYITSLPFPSHISSDLQISSSIISFPQPENDLFVSHLCLWWKYVRYILKSSHEYHQQNNSASFQIQPKFKHRLTHLLPSITTYKVLSRQMEQDMVSPSAPFPFQSIVIMSLEDLVDILFPFSFKWKFLFKIIPYSNQKKVCLQYLQSICQANGWIEIPTYRESKRYKFTWLNSNSGNFMNFQKKNKIMPAK